MIRSTPSCSAFTGSYPMRGWCSVKRTIAEGELARTLEVALTCYDGKEFFARSLQTSNKSSQGVYSQRQY